MVHISSNKTQYVDLQSIGGSKLVAMVIVTTNTSGTYYMLGTV
jgi:hypothetical protein